MEKEIKRKHEFESLLVDASAIDVKAMRPVYVGGMFFAHNLDTFEGWGLGVMRGKSSWALWVDGKGFVCGDSNMISPVVTVPMTMSKETAKRLCKTGIAHWGKVFFSENKDYYAKMIQKWTKKMGSIVLDNPVKVSSSIYGRKDLVVERLDYDEHCVLPCFCSGKGVYCLACCRDESVVRVGREMVRTLMRQGVKVR